MGNGLLAWVADFVCRRQDAAQTQIVWANLTNEADIEEVAAK